MTALMRHFIMYKCMCFVTEKDTHVQEYDVLTVRQNKKIKKYVCAVADVR